MRESHPSLRSACRAFLADEHRAGSRGGANAVLSLVRFGRYLLLSQ